MTKDTGYGWIFLTPYGTTQYRDQEFVYPLPVPGEKWGPWFAHPEPAKPDGNDYGLRRLRVMKRLSANYAPDSWWPWFVQWRGMIGEGMEKVDVQELRLRRVPQKVFWKYIRLGKCRGANLQYANLWGADLRNANLQGANLQYANLWGANLRGTGLRDADLQYTNLQNANLRDADLRHADLWNANLQEADLRRADLRRADLWEADFWGANLQRANLQEAKLWGANLREANLQEADLRRADLRAADLWEADLRKANMRNTFVPDNCKDVARL